MYILWKSNRITSSKWDAENLVTADLSNWNGKKIKIPRKEVQQCNRDDIRNAGVYFLFCKEDADEDFVYIGEVKNVNFLAICIEELWIESKVLMERKGDFNRVEQALGRDTIEIIVQKDKNLKEVQRI